MAIRKRWEDHSPRWQREHTKAGETKARWNRYLKLSDKTKKTTDARAYARGLTAARQRFGETYAKAYTTMIREIYGREKTVLRGLSMMTPAELKWTSTASAEAILGRARNTRYARNGHNPWWYR